MMPVEVYLTQTSSLGRFGLGAIVLKLPNRKKENTMNETEHHLGFLRELTYRTNPLICPA
jgi:hypothetical protein